jgi:hypothetical protein
MEEREKKSLKFLGNCRKGFPFSVRIATKAGSLFFPLNSLKRNVFIIFFFFKYFFQTQTDIKKCAQSRCCHRDPPCAFYHIFAIYMFYHLLLLLLPGELYTHNVHRRGLLNKEKSLLDGRDGGGGGGGRE